MGSHKLVQLVFIVSLIVVVTLSITFTALFTMYAKYKKKNIRNGHEDSEILNDLKKKYKIEDQKLNNENELDLSSDSVTKVSLVDKINESKKKKLVSKTFEKIISNILLIILAVIIIFIITYRAQNNAFYFKDNTYIAVQTGSMETKNAYNTYLVSNNLNNQIMQYSLIGIEKVDEKDIKLYDIIAFKNSEGDVIVHRVVKIEENNGKLLFTYKGDANTSSNIWELSLDSSSIIGRYTGFNSYLLGVATTYFKSSSGIVAVIAAFIFLMLYEVAEELIEQEYDARKEIVAKNYDESGEDND